MFNSWQVSGIIIWPLIAFQIFTKPWVFTDLELDVRVDFTFFYCTLCKFNFRTVTKQALCKWGHFETCSKMLLVSWTFYTLSKGFRSFILENLGSVGLRAVKLPAIKLWEWFNQWRTWIQADWFEWGWGQAADFFLRPPNLRDSNFKALYSTDPLSTALKDLNLLKKCIKNQEAS